ncbi:NDP-sugar synthase [Streptomyces pathocidini]|uniref:NDP-sugar synthase n=1 Tax=Streptomyces pathocidini TaxID=1650571 RepID=UPI00340847D7
MTEAILLVGGQGARLRPLTSHTPKPLLPVAGVPFLTHQLARAAAAGVTRVVFATSYRAEMFAAEFGDGSGLGLELDYVVEDEPLGTGGAIRGAAEKLRSKGNEPVLIFNGDILSDLDIAGLREGHRESGADVTLHLTRVPDPRAFGLVSTDADGRILDFLEKPDASGPIGAAQVNAGCYVFTRSVIDRIPPGRAVSVEREVFPELVASGAYLRGVLDGDYWLDLGTPAAFIQGSADLVRGRVDSPALPGRVGDALVLPGAQVDAGAVLSGGTVIGEGARVGAGAVIEGSVVLPGASVGAHADIRRSVLGRFAEVGSGSSLDSVVVGEKARIGADSELPSGIRIGCGVELPPGSVRMSAETAPCTARAFAPPAA